MPSGEQSVFSGVMIELESIGDSSLVEVELFMEMDFNLGRRMMKESHGSSLLMEMESFWRNKSVVETFLL